MKTYKKEINVPRLVIRQEEWAESPRKDSNIGYFFTKEGKYNSPDGKENPLYKLMIECGEEAEDTKDHIRLMIIKGQEMFRETKNEDLHIIEIHPVYRYEHGGVMYKRGTANGFDYSNCGFYIVTAKSLEGETYTSEKITEIIDAELEIYNKWVNGEVYQFTLYDDKGEIEDSCSGFYDIEDIREHLPEDWKDEDLNQYEISNNNYY